MACSHSDNYREYADKLYDEMQKKGFRVEIDERSEKIGYKIREAQLEKVPYMIIAGEKEMNEGTVSVRSRKQGDLGSMSLDAFMEMLGKEVDDKVI